MKCQICDYLYMENENIEENRESIRDTGKCLDCYDECGMDWPDHY